MSGQIFISYRREDASYPAGRLYDNLQSRFPQNEIFMDVDRIKPSMRNSGVLLSCKNRGPFRTGRGRGRSDRMNSLGAKNPHFTRKRLVQNGFHAYRWGISSYFHCIAQRIRQRRSLRSYAPEQTNVPEVALRWSVERAGIEFGLSSATLRKALGKNCAAPDKDGCYTTAQICGALFGDLHKEKIATQRQITERITLEKQITRGV
jgi:hypothetical protein